MIGYHILINPAGSLSDPATALAQLGIVQVPAECGKAALQVASKLRETGYVVQIVETEVFFPQEASSVLLGLRYLDTVAHTE